MDSNGNFEYQDALGDGPVKGRGAGIDPGNRYETVRLHVLGEHLDRISSQDDADSNRVLPDRQVLTHVLQDNSRTIINRVDSPDISFKWSVNPYRGCEHGCIYCYARPTHEQLGMSCGLDFETKIMAKRNAPRLLEQHLGKRQWKGEPVMMSGVTDPYQPVESDLRITRGCLEVMADCRQPVSVITKSRLILRDLDLLVRLAEHRAVSVAISITSLDQDLSRVMEPRASRPADRIETISRLTQAGVPVVAMVAPIVPGLNDVEVPNVLQSVKDAGAVSASYVLLRLPYQLKGLFLDWMARHYPERMGRVRSLIEQTHGGRLYDPTPGKRMRGDGPVANQIGAMFKLFRRRFGLDQPMPEMSSSGFRRPEKKDGTLFASLID